MKIEEGIYHITQGTSEYIVRVPTQKYICIPYGFFSMSFGHVDSEKRRQATYIEQRWFLACEKLDTFIPLEDIKQETYEIY